MAGQCGWPAGSLARAVAALTNASDAIHAALLSGNHVIISCNKGRSRSVAVAAAYLLRYKQIPSSPHPSVVIEEPFVDARSALWFLWGVKGCQGSTIPNLFEEVLDQLLPGLS